MGLSEHGVRLQSCDSKREDDKLKNHQSWGCTIYSQTNPHSILMATSLISPLMFQGCSEEPLLPGLRAMSCQAGRRRDTLGLFDAEHRKLAIGGLGGLNGNRGYHVAMSNV